MPMPMASNAKPIDTPKASPMTMAVVSREVMAQI